MRIIAGVCRSRMLRAPRGMDTRPTYDRVRETIFDIPQFEVNGAEVLDLYAGSGAMALESLSRGALRAVMCDADAEAVRTASWNAESLGLKDKCEILHMKDMAALEGIQGRGESFDLVFLDPPYRMDTTPVMGEIAARGLVKPRGVIVAEYRENKPGTPEGFALWKDRRIGSVSVRMYRKEETEG
ncbi:MAG: 16S rRNA (guanine(966)-N(2))-methyltransferase RsmD [Clostridia bacterium]|nr:16S rRNA (guanine(966)-N(2))-methyltransferase RsmD [Clostridia bacterium]